MRSAIIYVDFPVEENARIIFEALKPESCSQPTARSKVELSLKNDIIVLQIKAKDTTALRAAINAYLRWIYATQKVLEALKFSK
jgi:tRNA threonylcarbamoyladenosine modification (KEOPS) complex  Pcc1 subunit